MGHNSALKHKQNLHLTPKEFVIYANDVVVNFRDNGAKPPPPGEKQPVTEFTKKSRARLAFVASNTPIKFNSMMTLTYPKEWPKDGKEVKRNLKAMISRLKRRYKGIDYLWFLEFQKRGAPHVHLLLTCKSNPANKIWLSQAWHDIANEKHNEKHLKAGTNWALIRKQDGAKRYAIKYAMKMSQKLVPELYRNVGRFWGHSKNVKPEPMFLPIEIYSLEQMKKYLELWPYADKVDRPMKTLYNASSPLAEQLALNGIVIIGVDQKSWI